MKKKKNKEDKQFIEDKKVGLSITKTFVSGECVDVSALCENTEIALESIMILLQAAKRLQPTKNKHFDSSVG